MNSNKNHKKKILYRTLISHHPACEKFKNHTFKIGKVDFCIGCFIGYPAGILAIILGTYFHHKLQISTISLLYVGLFLQSSMGLSLFQISEIKWVKIIQKLFTGFGGGLILLYVYFSTIGSVWHKLFEVWGMFMILMAPLTILHYLNLKKTCKFCDSDYRENVCLFVKKPQDQNI